MLPRLRRSHQRSVRLQHPPRKSHGCRPKRERLSYRRGPLRRRPVRQEAQRRLRLPLRRCVLLRQQPLPVRQCVLLQQPPLLRRCGRHRPLPRPDERLRLPLQLRELLLPPLLPRRRFEHLQLPLILQPGARHIPQPGVPLQPPLLPRQGEQPQRQLFLPRRGEQPRPLPQQCAQLWLQRQRRP